MTSNAVSHEMSKSQDHVLSDSPRDDMVHVELRPFKHQVGGHTCVLEVGRTTICKPYVDREVWFYEHVPDQLKQFIPVYLGETSVTLDLSQNRKCLVATISRDLATRIGLDNSEKRVQVDGAFVLKRSRKRSRESEGHTDKINRDGKQTLASWSTTCIDRQINRYGFWANNQPQKFILLENLVADYRKPCLMDLKMGRRQYGGDSDEAKRKLLERRCAGTTSATLGFRICGSQSFKVATNSYTVHDKYVGRNLDDVGATQEIRHFFHNDAYLRTDVIKSILEKIERLQQVLESEGSLFLHSASLLLLYDGYVGIPNGNDSHSCGKGTRQSDADQGSSTLASETISSIKAENETSHILTPVPKDPKVLSTDKDIAKLKISASSVDTDQDIHADSLDLGLHNGHYTNEATTAFVNDITTRCDMRLIDFAHVSENQTREQDDSIMFGLGKLSDVLQQLLVEKANA